MPRVRVTYEGTSTGYNVIMHRQARVFTTSHLKQRATTPSPYSEEITKRYEPKGYNIITLHSCQVCYMKHFIVLELLEDESRGVR